MPPQTLVRRVETLEERVTILEQLPSRVDALASQISQLKDEMHAEFSAVRTEIRAGDEETRRSLVEVIRAGDDETRRVLGEADERILTQARVLHEEMISRLALSQEGGDRPSKQS